MEQHMPLTRMITLLARKNQRCIAEALKEYEITAAEQPFFVAIVQSDGITQEELTAIVSVDKAATARAVRSLEDKGYLIRRQNEKDKRQNLIYPTDKMRFLFPSLEQTLLEMSARVTEGLSVQEMETVYRSLVWMDRNFNLLLKENARKNI